MSESDRRGAWLCPNCGRQVPLNVEVCRCGLERSEADPFEESALPPPRPVAPGPADWLSAQVRAVREARASQDDLPRAWRVSVRSIFALSVAAVLVLTASDTFHELPPTHENIEVLARLDEFTRAAGSPENTIPGFLASPGTLAATEPSAPPTQLVKTVDEAHLRAGFCSSSIARLVRHEHPGFYDDWQDAKLERAVVERLPEYRRRLCALSYQVNALPADVVKYQLRARSIWEWASLIAWTLFVPATFAAICLLIYYRFVVGLISQQVDKLTSMK